MKAMIVDDEAKAREILELMLKTLVPEITEIRLAMSGTAASSHLASYEPDLVFLDIKMPEISGFEWLASLNERDFDVIFTTAFDEYAIKAIRYSAFDYLLKPVDPEDLRNAIDRYLSQASDRQNRYENLLYNVAQNDPGRFKLTIATTEGTHIVTPVEVIRCEADGNYTHFYLTHSRHILTSRSLGHYGDLLPDLYFIRCHKSHLVNKEFVERMTDTEIFLRDGMRVQVSRRRRAMVREAIAGYWVNDQGGK